MVECLMSRPATRRLQLTRDERHHYLAGAIGLPGVAISQQGPESDVVTSARNIPHKPDTC